jgi:hypothetical protein
MAVKSAESTQALASKQRARAEGMFHPLCDFDPASFFNSCLKNFIRLSAEFETALNESAKALAQAAEQKETDRAAMSKTISAFCWAFDLDDVPSSSSPQSHLRALGGHITVLGGPSTCSPPTMTWIWSGSARGTAYPTRMRPP